MISSSLKKVGEWKLLSKMLEKFSKVKVIVKSVKDTFAPEGEQAPLKLILSDVKDITANLKDLLEGNKEKLDGIVDNLDTFTESLAFMN